MPVGTQGTIKGLPADQLQAPPLDFRIILGNTYHLANRPGTELLAQQGGLHKFMHWGRNILTDSGGFQMVSLLQLAEITEEGVAFQSPNDGTRMLLRPEDSIAHQNRIGSDIIMALDDVAPSTIEDPVRFAEASARTIRWLDRCIAAHSRPTEQCLFGIVQGGLDVRPLADGGLREVCMRDMMQRDASLPGYAIGGLAGGEDKISFIRVVACCTARLPRDKPRYLMGVGYPLDLVVCSTVGVDMFDCVYPTRTGRFGTAMVPEGLLKLKNAAYATDARPICDTCQCFVCRDGRYRRSYVHALLKSGAALGAQLVTYHNLAYLAQLMRSLREAVIAGPAHYARFVRSFLRQHFGLTQDKPLRPACPEWVRFAMDVGGIELDCDDDDAPQSPAHPPQPAPPPTLSS